jgi:hypothetical protein
MKYIIIALSFLAFIIISCKAGKDSNALLSKPGDIKGDEYVIAIDRDTTLVTKNGALLKIPKGTLTTGKGNTATLEIKEAYSIQQMIQLGLTTQSGGEPLSSGGMIYINAAGGQNVTINKAIKVAIPTNYLNRNMELFKGEQAGDGSVDWKDPVALPENGLVRQIEQGRVLFESQCASCHKIGQDATGPDLAHFLKRFSGDKLLTRGFSLHIPYLFADSSFENAYSNQFQSKLQHLSPELWDNQFQYFCNLKLIYGSLGTGFPDLNEQTLEGLYQYVQNESNRRNLPLPSHAYLDDCIDSCRLYKEKVGSLQNQKQIAEQKKKGLIKDNGPLVDIKTQIPTGVDGNSETTPENLPAADFEKKVSPRNYDAVYYQFTIENFGWFNIDVLLRNVNGVEESELFVRIAGEYRERIKVFLIIPSEKVYGEGGPAERNPDEFAFFYKSGKLPLPQNVKAYIMAVTETESSMAFALQEFTTGRQQQLDISLKASTKQEFEAAIQRISLDELNIKVSDAKNAREIRRTDAAIKNIDEEIKKVEDLRPKRCDCDCVQYRYFPMDTTITVESPK